MDMTIRPSVMMNACVAGIAALLVGCGNPVDPHPPTYGAPIPATAPLATTPAAAPTNITQAGMAVWPGSNSAIYASGKADSLEACVAFGREALYQAGTLNAPFGRLTCFDSNNKPAARFVCKADAGCTQVAGFN